MDFATFLVLAFFAWLIWWRWKYSERRNQRRIADALEKLAGRPPSGAHDDVDHETPGPPRYCAFCAHAYCADCSLLTTSVGPVPQCCQCRQGAKQTIRLL